MDTIGEAQVTQFFSNPLQDEIQKKWGHNAIFLFGNFAGKQDKKFADFFAGTRSKNILIEFKESKRNLKDELRKPLRKSLCFTLNDEIATLLYFVLPYSLLRSLAIRLSSKRCVSLAQKDISGTECVNHFFRGIK